MNTKNKQKKFWVVWGPIFNQSTGDLVVDEQTFSLVPIRHSCISPWQYNHVIQRS